MLTGTYILMFCYMVIGCTFIHLAYIRAVKESSNTFRKLLLLTTCFFTIVYLWWRLFYTRPIDGVFSIIIFILFFSSELYDFISKAVFNFMFWEEHKVQHVSVKELDKLPYVDVFIVTYNEGIGILKKTVAGCLNLEYPKELLRVYVCDDGKREAVKSMCKDFNVKYITRDKNEHAKAGNINNALQHSEGEYILIMDADMVPKSDFLLRTMGHFKDPEVGFVQTPQTFYNSDPFQYNLYLEDRLPNEQDTFMRYIQERRSRFNAVLFVGSNAIFRRKAILDIGGIPTKSIAEDMAAGMLIQDMGYKTVFVNEVLASGLAAESYTDFIQQRERWCRGTIQVWQNWNPTRLKGLSIIQKIIYLDSMFYWSFCIRKMIYLICPVLYFMLGIEAFKASIWDAIVFWVPHSYAMTLSLKLFFKNSRSRFWTSVYETCMAPYIAVAVICQGVLKRKASFIVTPKGKKKNKVDFLWRPALPHIIMLAFSLIAVCMFVLNLKAGRAQYLYQDVIFLILALQNIAALMMAVFVAFDRRRVRETERFVMESKKVFIKNADIQNTEILLTNLSENGAKLKVHSADNTLKCSDGETLQLDMEGVGEINCEIKWVKIDEGSIGVSFSDLTKEQYIKLIDYIYGKSKLIKEPYMYKKGGFIHIVMSLGRQLLTIVDLPGIVQNIRIDRMKPERDLKKL